MMGHQVLPHSPIITPTTPCTLQLMDCSYCLIAPMHEHVHFEEGLLKHRDDEMVMQHCKLCGATGPAAAHLILVIQGTLLSAYQQRRLNFLQAALRVLLVQRRTCNPIHPESDNLTQSQTIKCFHALLESLSLWRCWGHTHPGHISAEQQRL